ncbi:Asp-tRNA(Asn)/Glu-tRNA(Gln) amidotransferase subunit GatB [Candidatus Berkelbacteria bacterium CG_4_10_14_0_8_um_filter_39_42]|nr:MAG: Asp-tRNA(Asn)/Glu-tRNA(Gln) amidotransferase subunit GatB [Candidatus Berkelbacteria bacterium CG_4_10_14_0_8_um_filter_39_42]
MKNFEVTIGLEIHTELNTQSKMFCSCKNDPFNSEPNTNVCPTCLGLPGSLPVPNKQAILDTIKIGKALGSTIAIATKWDRKHYFYPDLPKNFQISQFDQPICEGGYLPLADGKVALTRIHLEEDTGKLTHFQSALALSEKKNYSLIDLNRAGVPLVELVTEPVIHSAIKAREFCEEYQLVLRTLSVSSADMEKGEMRCEVNISLRENHRKQETNSKQIPNFNDQDFKLGTKVEIKNLNSFRAVERAIQYEIKRQTEMLEKGEKIIQETRGWNDSKQKTYAQRVKETSADYRYFPEPDIPPIETSELQKESGKLPEMPWEKRKKFMRWGLAEKDASILAKDLGKADYFERSAKSAKDKKGLANLFINDASEMNIKAEDLASIANEISSGKINRKIAQEIIRKKENGADLKKLFSQYQKIGDTNKLEKIVKKVIAENLEVVSKIKAGKKEAIAFLIGCVMAETRGQAEAEIVAELISRSINNT